MDFIELNPEDFRTYALKSPYKSFYQTPEIANLRESNGWVPYYFGVRENGHLKAAIMLTARPAFLGKSIFYSPGGPLIDFEDTTTLDFLVRHLKRYIKSHNGYVLHIEPYYELIERDRDGEVVEGGFDHRSAAQNLTHLGFQKLSHADAPQYEFVLDINGRTPDELLASFKRNTRNHIRKAEKQGVVIRELEKSELPRFKKITESTSARRHFDDKPLSYYEKMYDLFHPRGEVQFIIAEVTPSTPDAKDSSSSQDGASTASFTDQSSTSTTSAASQFSTSTTPVKSQPTIDLSAAMFMTYGDEVIYLFSGSDERYMREYNAQYLIQWHMIKYAAEHGFKHYNFYGINGLPDPASPDYGIYDFKKGFGGHVVELIGAYELPTSPVFYHLHKFLKKLKSK